MNNGIDLKKLGTNLRKVREMELFKQSDVAEYLGVDQSLISKYESGERVISAEALERLSNLYCCPVKDLIDKDVIQPKGKVAYRTEGLTPSDSFILAEVNSIILNQLEMDGIIYGENR